MPDLERMSSELTTGKFNDKLLATRLDTLERNDALFGEPRLPQITYIPKDLSTDNILQSGKLPSVSDYLDSPDPKLNKLGMDYLASDSQRNITLNTGIGLPDMVRYQPGQEKFTTDHWWSESGKTKFGFNPDKSMAENENLYHEQVWDNYSFGGKAWRGVGTFAGRVLSKLTTGLVGMVGDIGSMAWNGLEEIIEASGGPKNNFWADVSDNVLSRAMHNVDEYVKQEILPTYKSINYDEKGAFAKLTDPYFWQNDMAEGAGFLLQFAIPATVLGKLTTAAKTARIAGEASTFQKILAAGVGETATAGRFAKATGRALETLTGSRNVGGIAAHAFNTTMESVAETKDGFDASVKDLMSKGYSEEEAKRIAAERAPTQFGLNMMILTASNAFENKWFQKLAGNRVLRREAVDAAGDIAERKAFGKFFRENAIGKRVAFYGKIGAQGMAMEGFWEENAQAAAGRVAAGSYMRRGDDTLSEGRLTKSKSFFPQLLQQTIDASWWGKGDKEVADSIMAGAVLGLLGGGGFAKLSGDKVKGKILPLGERKQRERDNANLVASVKNAKAAWMDINVMPDDLFNDDGTFNEEKVKQRTKDINAKLDKIHSMFTRKATIDDIKDPIKREYLKDVLFGDFIRGHILHGTGEQLISKMKDWSNKSPEELAMYGLSPEMIENPQEWADMAQELFDKYRKIEDLKFDNPDGPDKLSVKEYMNRVSAIRAHLFDFEAQKIASKNTLNKYSMLEDEYNPFNKTPSVFNMYNELAAKAEFYRQNMENPNADARSKAFFTEEYGKMKEKLRSLKTNLTDYDTLPTSNFLFEKGTNIKQREAEILQTVSDYTEFQWEKDSSERSIREWDTLINEYSDQATGLTKWKDEVKKWTDIAAKMEVKRMAGLGYSEYETVNMSQEQRDLILLDGIKREDNPEFKEADEAKAAEKAAKEAEKTAETPTSNQPSLEELKNTLFEEIKLLYPDARIEKIDENMQLFLAEMQVNPDMQLPESFMEAMLAYNQAKVEALKQQATGQFTNASTNEPDNKSEVEVPITLVETKEEKIERLEKELESITDDNNPRIAEIDAELTALEQVPQTIKVQQLRPLSELRQELADMKAKRLEWIRLKKNEYDKDAFEDLERQIDEWVDAIGETEKAVDIQVRDLNDERKKNGLEILTVEEALPILESVVTPPLPPPIKPVEEEENEPGMVPPSLLDEVRKAYRLHEQALENDTTFKEESEKEGLVAGNNKIDDHFAIGKNDGTINVVTSNHKDLEKGAIRSTDNNLARFNFLDNLSSRKLKKEDYKLVLGVGKNGGIYGIVADKDGNFVKFDDSGMPFKDGDNLLFFLDGFDLYNEQNIGKRRSEVVTPPFSIAPLTATPIILHPSFANTDVISILKDRIKNGKVTASISFTTQGMLYREGVNNTYNIPKNSPTTTAKDIISKGHTKEEKGFIPSENENVGGTYQHASRIHFPLLKDINNPSAGTEIAEFHPVSLQNAVTEDGRKVLDVIKTETGENIIEAGVKGNLEATAENMRTLTSLLRPDKYFILNLGTVIQIIDLKKFKKFLTLGKITHKELMKLTKVEDVYKSPLNIRKIHYDGMEEVSLYEGLLSEGEENYSRFINMNIVTSAMTIKKSPSVEGYTRINKRMTITVDNNMEELKKAQNQEVQMEQSPSNTVVKLPESLSEEDVLKVFNNPDPAINLGDATKDDC